MDSSGHQKFSEMILLSMILSSFFDSPAPKLTQSSENKASTISKHLRPGMTLRSIWFMT